MEFVHLHVHSEYSFPNGVCRLPNLIEKASLSGMSALALTDRNGLYGAIEFYQLARRANIKPIIGCELTLLPNYQLVLLVKNLHGYENLVRLVTNAHLKESPVGINKEQLRRYSEGLIALDGFLRGEIGHLLQLGKYSEAEQRVREYQQIYPGNFYLEIQNHGLKAEEQYIRLTSRLSQKTGTPMAATNDVHYLGPDESEVHELLTSIRTGQTLQQANEFILPNREYYLKSPHHMKSLFAATPEAIHNTVKISERCNINLTLGYARLPSFQLPAGYSSHDDYLLFLCKEGLRARYKDSTDKIKTRLSRELRIISEMKLAPYFLIVADLVTFARKNGITVGPGRGSATGSLVVYLLGITDIDPLKYNLFFERFLNPERYDLPDIDLDLCSRRRAEVLSYLIKKYGGNVAQIEIFNTLGARGAVRDVGKALGLSPGKINLVARNLPQFSGVGGIQHAVSTLPEFKKIPVNREPFRTLIKKSIKVEGRIRHMSVHPAGVVIGQNNLMNLVPLEMSPGGQIITQYGPESLASLGLMKIDLLGLRNLTIINDTLKLVAKTKGLHLTPAAIPLNDSSTYELLQKGETLGCFQMESPGIRNLLKRLKPENLNDIIAMLALYRPGPWDTGSVEGYLKRRHQQEKITYPHPILEPVLKDTYGIILFQEQVMQIACIAAGYSLRKADLFRKAIAKGLSEDARDDFIQACLNKGLKYHEAFKILSSLTRLGGYSFNKAHSTAYAFISYQTAYLKANHPLEYFAALLSSQTGYYNTSVYMEEANHRGIKFLLPDINRSSVDFIVENDRIRLGMGIINGVGIRSIQEILASRMESGEFPSLYDFCSRVDIKVVNHRVIKNLIKTGAFDFTGCNRPEMLVNLETVIKAVKSAKQIGQPSLWNAWSQCVDSKSAEWLHLPDYSEQEKSAIECELLSVSLNQHPLHKCKQFFQEHNIRQIDTLDQLKEGTRVAVAGAVINCRRQPIRNGTYLLYILLQDESAQAEVIVFPRIYENYLYELDPEGILVKGKINYAGEQVRIIAESIQSLDSLITGSDKSRNI